MHNCSSSAHHLTFWIQQVKGTFFYCEKLVNWTPISHQQTIQRVNQFILCLHYPNQPQFQPIDEQYRCSTFPKETTTPTAEILCQCLCLFLCLCAHVFGNTYIHLKDDLSKFQKQLKYHRTHLILKSIRKKSPSVLLSTMTVVDVLTVK